MKTVLQFPKIVTFRITSKCNNACKHCFGPPKNIEDMNFLRLKALFSLFYKNKVEAVVLTGGEPLVRNDFEKIVNELKKYSLRIFLDTNGDLFFRYKDLISKSVDVLGLPIDFPNKAYRNFDNLNNIIKILDFLKNKEKRPIIRIGTVITKDNINELEQIGDLIKEYPIDIWKIYEFTPQNINAVKNKSLLEVSPEEFDKATQRVKEKFSKYSKIVISKRKDRTNAYFFIASNGKVFMPVDDLDICREIEIGHIFDSDIINKWKRFVSENKYVTNAKLTFNMLD